MENKLKIVDPAFPDRNMGIIQYVKDKCLTNVELGVRICRTYNSGRSRLMRFYIGNEEVTNMVANAIGLKLSKSGPAIVRGCGMEMPWYCTNSLYWAARRAGYGDVFSEHFYKLLS